MKTLKNIFYCYQRKAAGMMWIAVAGIFVFAYVTLVSSIPDKIYLSEAGDRIDISLPVVFQEKNMETAEASGNVGESSGGLSENVKMEKNHRTYNCKLFGLIPVKEVTAEVVGEKKVLAGGMSVGIYVETDGILVIGTGNVTDYKGDSVTPAENLVKSGDYIRKMNDKVLTNKEQLIEAVGKCEGKKVILEILREGEIIEVAIDPIECEDGSYKLGLWVRDDLAGIGTLTYVTEQMEYGALGHGVSDADTGLMLNLKEGLLYEGNIVGIVKGESGSPGELTGVINYREENCLGSIEKNNEVGIYGSMRGMTDEYRDAEWIEVAFKQEIQTGEAEILSKVDDTVKRYTIDITEIDYQGGADYREIMFEVTDKELLEKTGGIVQGMSGSPVIQNGRIVGAVTHVLVNDPTRGYGIFIENMLEHN